MHHEYSGWEFESRSRISFNFFSYQYFAQFSRLSRNEKGEHYFLCILTCFIQLYSVIKHAYWTFIQNMAEKSTESCVSLKGNDKALFNSSKCYKGNGGSKKGAMVNLNI